MTKKIVYWQMRVCGKPRKAQFKDLIHSTNENVCGARSTRLWNCNRPKGHRGAHEGAYGELTLSCGVWKRKSRTAPKIRRHGEGDGMGLKTPSKSETKRSDIYWWCCECRQPKKDGGELCFACVRQSFFDIPCVQPVMYKNNNPPHK